MLTEETLKKYGFKFRHGMYSRNNYFIGLCSEGFFHIIEGANPTFMLKTEEDLKRSYRHNTGKELTIPFFNRLFS